MKTPVDLTTSAIKAIALQTIPRASFKSNKESIAVLYSIAAAIKVLLGSLGEEHLSRSAMRAMSLSVHFIYEFAQELQHRADKTTVMPDGPGWYWYRPRGSGVWHVVEVNFDGDHFTVREFGGRFNPEGRAFSGDYFGPIQPPSEGHGEDLSDQIVSGG